jgi:hypothetical protein
MPLAGTRVIPSGWSDHHRPVVAGTRTGTVAWRKPAGTKGAFNGATGTQAATPATAYFTGSARIQALAEAGATSETGGQQVTITGYLVTVAWDATDQFEVDDLGEVAAVDANGDPGLVGKTLIVKSVARGSLVWERDLYCTLDLG